MTKTQNFLEIRPNPAKFCDSQPPNSKRTISKNRHRHFWAADICTVNIDFFLFTVNRFSNYFEIDVLKNTNWETIIDICPKEFKSKRHSTILYISDIAPNLVNPVEFKRFASVLDFTKQRQVFIAQLLIKNGIKGGEAIFTRIIFNCFKCQKTNSRRTIPVRLVYL